MREGWKVVLLGDLLKKIIGGGTPSKSKPEYWNGDILWCSVKDMQDDRFTIADTVDRITELGLKNSSANLIPKGTVITATRMGLGRAFIAETDMAINQDLKALIPNAKIDNNFLLWAIVSNRNNLENLGSGSTVMGIRLETLKSIKINLPPLKTQRKIASILSAYDDLIENNLKRIKLLEEQAQQTYEEWFVRFKFPGYESVGIDEVSGLPVGWERKRFDKLIILQRGFDLPSRIRKDGKIPIFASTGITDYHNEFKVKGPGIITGRSGTLGQVQYTSEDFWPLNTALWVKKYFNCGPIYVLHFLRSLNLENFGGGSAVPSLDRKVVHSQKINIPNTQLLKDFENYCRPHFKVIDNLTYQNQLLKEARDILLPRLMDGVIDVERLGVNEELSLDSYREVAKEKIAYK